MKNTLPRIHVQPRKGWLNDPNGMVFHRGAWHVFYQANPVATKHENVSWGHVSSRDFVTWREYPTAFGPGVGQPDEGGAWSGVYFPWLSKPAVAYTAIKDTPRTSTVVIREALDDDLVTWSAPRVVAQTPAEVREMRDPFCFEWQGRRLALLGAQLDGDVPAVLLWDVSDPLDWGYLGVWARAEDAASLPPESHFWECPQLIIDGDQALLVVSLWVGGQTVAVAYLSGEVAGGFGGDLGLPKFTIAKWGWMDTGDVFYAPQIAALPASEAGPDDPSDGDHSPGYLMFGWVREPDDDFASMTGVQGCLTLPRAVKLGPDGRPHQKVIDELRWLADASERQMVPVKTGDVVQLPRLGRAQGIAPHVTFEGARGRFDVQFPEGEFEVWTDGEIVEIYSEGIAPVTVRQNGTQTWRMWTWWPTTVVLTDLRHIVPDSP